jgi:hypothetical protein
VCVALPFWTRRPAFRDDIAGAGGQKEIDHTDGAPERKRHSHEDDNKDRNFAPSYTFHFSARIEPILRSTLIRNISLPRDAAPRAFEQREQDSSGDKTQAQEKGPGQCRGLSRQRNWIQYLATTGPPQSKV